MIRTLVFWGLYWRSLILGNYQIEIIEGLGVRRVGSRDWIGFRGLCRA